LGRAGADIHLSKARSPKTAPVAAATITTDTIKATSAATRRTVIPSSPCCTPLRISGGTGSDRPPGCSAPQPATGATPWPQRGPVVQPPGAGAARPRRREPREQHQRPASGPHSCARCSRRHLLREPRPQRLMGHVDASQVPELGGDLPPRHATATPVCHQILERACITEEPIGCRVEGGLGHVAIMGPLCRAVKSQT
jgi:hypothetical protein